MEFKLCYPFARCSLLTLSATKNYTEQNNSLNETSIENMLIGYSLGQAMIMKFFKTIIFITNWEHKPEENWNKA